MEVLLVLVSALLTFLFPIIALIFNVLSFFFARKFRKFFSLMVAMSLASIAYTWSPSNVYDLYSWHLEILKFTNYDFQELLNFISINYEPVNYLLKYFCSKIGDYNLIQFIVTLFGYYIMLWMISDCAKKENINNFSVAIVTIFTVLSLKYINFISGLWFNFAIINFSLGIYLNYIRKTKWIHWIFYVLSLLIHISIIYLFIILLITKLIKTRKFKAVILITFLIFLFVGPLLTILDSNVNLSLVHYIFGLYQNYFLNGDKYSTLHTGMNLYEAILKYSICLVFIYFNTSKLKDYDNNYLLFLSIVGSSIIALVFVAKIIMVRYSFFFVLITIPILLDYFSKKQKKVSIFIINAMFVVFIFLGYRQYQAIVKADLPNCINHNITRNILSLENGYY